MMVFATHLETWAAGRATLFSYGDALLPLLPFFLKKEERSKKGPATKAEARERGPRESCTTYKGNKGSRAAQTAGGVHRA